MYFVHVYIYIYIFFLKKEEKEKILNEKVTFSKIPNFFFLFQDKKEKKSLLFKMVHENPLDKTFSKS